MRNGIRPCHSTRNVLNYLLTLLKSLFELVIGFWIFLRYHAKETKKGCEEETLASFYKLIALEVMTTSNLEILLGEEGHANHIELLYHGSTNTRRLDAPPFEPPSKIISMSRKR